MADASNWTKKGGVQKKRGKKLKKDHDQANEPEALFETKESYLEARNDHEIPTAELHSHADNQNTTERSNYVWSWIGLEPVALSHENIKQPGPMRVSKFRLHIPEDFVVSEDASNVRKHVLSNRLNLLIDQNAESTENESNVMSKESFERQSLFPPLEILSTNSSAAERNNPSIDERALLSDKSNAEIHTVQPHSTTGIGEVHVRDDIGKSPESAVFDWGPTADDNKLIGSSVPRLMDGIQSLLKDYTPIGNEAVKYDEPTPITNPSSILVQEYVDNYSSETEDENIKDRKNMSQGVTNSDGISDAGSPGRRNTDNNKFTESLVVESCVKNDTEKNSAADESVQQRMKSSVNIETDQTVVEKISGADQGSVNEVKPNLDVFAGSEVEEGLKKAKAKDFSSPSNADQFVSQDSGFNKGESKKNKSGKKKLKGNKGQEASKTNSDSLDLSKDGAGNMQLNVLREDQNISKNTNISTSSGKITSALERKSKSKSSSKNVGLSQNGDQSTSSFFSSFAHDADGNEILIGSSGATEKSSLERRPFGQREYTRDIDPIYKGKQSEISPTPEKGTNEGGPFPSFFPSFVSNADNNKSLVGSSDTTGRSSIERRPFEKYVRDDDHEDKRKIGVIPDNTGGLSEERRPFGQRTYVREAASGDVVDSNIKEKLINISDTVDRNVSDEKPFASESSETIDHEIRKSDPKEYDRRKEKGSKVVDAKERVQGGKIRSEKFPAGTELSPLKQNAVDDAIKHKSEKGKIEIRGDPSQSPGSLNQPGEESKKDRIELHDQKSSATSGVTERYSDDLGDASNPVSKSNQARRADISRNDELDNEFENDSYEISKDWATDSDSEDGGRHVLFLDPDESGRIRLGGRNKAWLKDDDRDMLRDGLKNGEGIEEVGMMKGSANQIPGTGQEVKEDDKFYEGIGWSEKNAGNVAKSRMGRNEKLSSAISNDEDKELGARGRPSQRNDADDEEDEDDDNSEYGLASDNEDSHEDIKFDNIGRGSQGIDREDDSAKVYEGVKMRTGTRYKKHDKEKRRGRFMNVSLGALGLQDSNDADDEEARESIRVQEQKKRDDAGLREDEFDLTEEDVDNDDRSEGRRFGKYNVNDDGARLDLDLRDDYDGDDRTNRSRNPSHVQDVDRRISQREDGGRGRRVLWDIAKLLKRLSDTLNNDISDEDGNTHFIQSPTSQNGQTVLGGGGRASEHARDDMHNEESEAAAVNDDADRSIDNGAEQDLLREAADLSRRVDQKSFDSPDEMETYLKSLQRFIKEMKSERWRHLLSLRKTKNIADDDVSASETSLEILDSILQSQNRSIDNAVNLKDAHAQWLLFYEANYDLTHELKRERHVLDVITNRLTQDESEYEKADAIHDLQLLEVSLKEYDTRLSSMRETHQSLHGYTTGTANINDKASIGVLGNELYALHHSCRQLLNPALVEASSDATKKDSLLRKRPLGKRPSLEAEKGGRTRDSATPTTDVTKSSSSSCCSLLWLLLLLILLLTVMLMLLFMLSDTLQPFHRLLGLPVHITLRHVGSTPPM